MLEAIQKLIPWASDLPLIPKLSVSAVIILLAFVFLYIIWAPKPVILPQENPTVIQAYERMKRVLTKLGQTSDGTITVDGNPIEERLSDYYTNYLAIADFIANNPNDIIGAYEKVWENGGEGRVFINDTEVFETVVSAFFRSFENASNENK